LATIRGQIIPGGKPSEYEIPMKNEILEELWANKDALARECNYDIREIAAKIDTKQTSRSNVNAPRVTAIYESYVRKKINDGVKSADSGDLMSHESVKKRLRMK
jgi:hypothetical protein